MAESGSTPPEKARVPSSVSPSPAPDEASAGTRRFRVLLGEDSASDVRLVAEALRHHGIDFELTVKRNGEAMLEWIDRLESRQEPCPDIVLLDLNLPRYDGITILRRLRESAVCSHLPVIIVTSSDAMSDRVAASQLGATSYFRKPLDYDEFLMLGGLVKQVLSGGPATE